MPERDDIKSEIYRTVLLLQPDPILLKVLESWCAGADDAEVLADLRNWNEAKALEMEEWAGSLSGKDMEGVQRKLREYAASKGPERKAA